MSRPLALVIGDVMLDQRTEGEMRTISSEAPAPVVGRQFFSESLGGAGNTARNIKALGHDVLMIGFVGNDAHGRRIAELASQSGITACLPQWGRPTVVKHRITCGGHIIARLDIDGEGEIPHSTLLAGLYSIPAETLAMIRVVVISDYNKGTMNADVMAAIKQLVDAYKVQVFVDARPATLDLYRGVSLLKVNLREAMGALTDVVHPGLADGASNADKCGTACRELSRKYAIPLVVVTDGPRGCHYTDPDDEYRVHVCEPAKADGDVRDVCGAGDTVLAALAVGLLESRNFAISVVFAMDAASYVVRFYGVHPAYRDDVEEFIYENGGWAHKLMDQSQLIDFVSRRRRLNPFEQIVFTNGCFDGLHAGHIETLMFAAKQGTTLIVAYNDDASLVALKGVGRPHVPDSFRSKHLAIQECVDVVARFDGDVSKLVAAIKPDVLVKGADAASKPVPGADYVAAHGGRVVFCPMDQFAVRIDREGSQDKCETPTQTGQPSAPNTP